MLFLGEEVNRPNINAPNSSPFVRKVGVLIDGLCWIALISTVVTVIYGLLLRARFEQNYGIAVIIAIFGAFVLFVGMAQQAIAARDHATWEGIALWRLRALQRKAGEELNEGEQSALMDKQFVEAVSATLLAEMRRGGHDGGSDS